MAEEIQATVSAQPRAALAVLATPVASLGLQVSSDAVASVAAVARAELALSAQDSVI